MRSEELHPDTEARPKRNSGNQLVSVSLTAEEERSPSFQVLDGLLPDSTYEVHVIAHTSMAGPQSKVVTVTTEEAAPSGSPNNVR